jgi:probable F420-dependent oxidoreductase
MNVMKIRFAISPHAGLRTSTDVFGFAAAIESAGFDGIWLSDLPAGPTLDPLLALALVAGRTERLRLGANVVPLGRNPFLLAKELAQLDRLSDGRLLLSFVTGVNQAGEREVYGLNGAARGAVLEEVLGLAREWWSGAAVTHRSERWTFTGLDSPARPVQDPLEVWLGGRGPQALDRVGRVADGWLGAQLTPPETAVAREAIQAAAAAAGREVDPEHFGLSIPYARTPPAAEVLHRLGARRADVDPVVLVPVGAGGLRAVVDGCIAAGLSKFVVRPVGAVTDWADEAAWLAAAILDLQT